MCRGWWWANPATGDVVPALWLDPRIFGRFGADGAQGVSGLDGIAGSRGDDGVGTEFVFAVTNSATLPNNQRPLNTWGYDQPGTVNGLTWSDGAPDVTASFPYLWRAQRIVVGQPPIGTAITDTWDEPSVEGRYGEDGDDGIAGARGDDGAGVEYVFAVTNSATLPSSQNPANSWGYDNPGTRGGLTWHDAAPNVTEATPYLWRAERAVEAVPAFNAAVSDSWSTPTINSRFGPQGIAGIAGSDGGEGAPGTPGAPGADGSDGARGTDGSEGAPGSDGAPGADGSDGVEGAPGSDGVGIEFIFATTNADTLPSSQRPSNSWGYDDPGSVGGLQWFDGAPNLSATAKFLWGSARRTEGIPADGAAVSGLWTVPKIVGAYGEEGIGIEFIFAVTNADTLPTSQRPSNSWGYDDPGSVGGLQWFDGAPNVSATVRFLWRSVRQTEGIPAQGAAVPGLWTVPSIEGVFGEQGEEGEQGLQGEDGSNVLFDGSMALTTTESDSAATQVMLLSTINDWALVEFIIYGPSGYISTSGRIAEMPSSPSSAYKIFIPPHINLSGEDVAHAYRVSKNSAGTQLTFRADGQFSGGSTSTLKNIFGVRLASDVTPPDPDPTTTTDTDYVYRLATSTPSTPSGGTHDGEPYPVRLDTDRAEPDHHARGLSRATDAHLYGWLVYLSYVLGERDAGGIGARGRPARPSN